MNKAASFLKSRDTYLFIIRYALSMEMMGYGLLKIIGLQTKVFQPFSAWQQPLEDTTGTHLTWAFLGYSSWFVILLGLFEFIPSVLLLFRRTTLLGAILLFPMTLSVFLINYSLDLWTYTKQLSLALLTLNLTIFLFEWQKLKNILEIIIGKTRALKHKGIELSLNILLIATVVYLTTFPPHPFYDIHEKNALIGDWTKKHPLEWSLVSEKLNNSTLPHHSAKLYFGPKGIYSEINDSTTNGDHFIRYSLNEEKHALYIAVTGYRGKHTDYPCYFMFTGSYQYNIIGDTILRLSRTTGNKDSSMHTWTFKRRVMNMNKY